ncbi:dysbindin protein homolog [Neocloeon triangulifer]|uniref:dysbindin protein homolog n=1 Tax=Neocloeon triangulifer TaxID=2078957 RepID=UPI00286EE9FF|nr:dysbindin protein homolog [Neocloeon triangulifer]
MFGSIRDKLQNVQEGISASFRLLTVSEVPRKSKSSPSRNKINLNAGAELLDKYQTDWKELHEISEENAKNAEVVDQLIEGLHKSVSKQWTDIGNLCKVLNEVPNLIIRVQDLMDDVNNLKHTFEDVEHSLLAFEDLVETQALQEEQLEHRFQLAMYKEKKLAELEDCRKKLEQDYSEKLKQHDEQQKKVLMERQAAFQKVFSEDMTEFKKSGHIPKLEVRGQFEKEVSLEEVDLDADESALDEFLRDVDNDSDTNIDFAAAPKSAQTNLENPSPPSDD